ncbi:MAG: sodium:solute symporter [Saprospiraceae bacterium]|nr:sodium:solute symporter [Saprospiraceae bacterium]
MSAYILFAFVFGYFVLLLFVAYFTSRNSNNDSFFIGNKNSNWLLVTFGMIGTSLSGVTFVSVPGTVGLGGFGYYQVVIGYFLGYFVIAFILLPLYYKLNLTSIYRYLEDRFGPVTYRTGAIFFILSRTLGATARMFLVINILQLFILDALGVPFVATAFIILLLILLYTFEGGVKTIVYTDTLQTTFMLGGLIACILAIMYNLNFGIRDTFSALSDANYIDIFNTNVLAPNFFLKQILGGAFITIAMTGLDQEMMQKNISVKTLWGSQKNVLTLAFVLLIVNLLFLILGGLLYLFASKNGLTVTGDDIFPTIALKNYLSSSISIVFIIGLISALFPSADGALTAMTSSFCIDILGMQKDILKSSGEKRRTRLAVHLSFAILFFICVLVFKWINDKSIIDVILKLAGYTYGPLLGLFAFGIFTRRNLSDKKSIWICLLSPLIIFILDFINNIEWFSKKLSLSDENSFQLIQISNSIFSGYKIGIEMLILNGIITFIGLYMISKKAK